MAIVISAGKNTIASDLLKGALRVSTVIGRGFTPSSEDIADALEACNQMLGSWSAKGILVPYRTRETLTPSTSASSYSIGSGGAFDTTRPIQIEGVTVQADGIDYVLRRMDLAEYNRESVKGTASISSRYYYEPTYPTGTLYFDFKPSTSSSIIIDSIKPLTKFTTQGDLVSLPEGYEEAIKFNLARRLCTEYGRPIPVDVERLAMETYDAIYSQSLSHRVNTASVDAALLTRGGYNVLTDR